MSKFATKHGMSRAKIYKLWTGMIQRCGNPKSSGYDIYGAVGITVCDHWKSFENFYKDMGEKPEECSLDRIDGKLGYSKENCRWATQAEQLKNRKPYVSKKNSVGLQGVYWKQSHNKFVARKTVDGKRVYVGFFNTIDEAAAALNS